MIDTLRIALSSKMRDKDDFKKLILSSNNERVYIYKDENGFVCQSGNDLSFLSEDEVFGSIETFIKNGFRKLICESYSGGMNIDIPEHNRGQLKITRTQPSTIPEITDTDHLINPDEIKTILEKIEIASSDGSIKADMWRKYIQIDNFIKLIYPSLVKISQRKKVFILDCAAGKSYLSYIMNYFVREKMHRTCHFFCIDTNTDLIEKCIRIRNELKYNNMEFYVSKIKDFQPSEKVDIVCSLHACDTASDEAIAKGIQLSTSYLLIVPCCQHEVINQLREHPLKAITRHGVFKARLADLITDAMRVLILEAFGYKVSVTEYISPMYTPKNIMIQAEKIQSRNKMAMEQYLEIKTMLGNISIELENMLSDHFRA
ncbi:MAG: class I SAM-dependent methyltransferase [bacterium]